jgi:phosphoenolpyruvate---glycerone phosphotransferase subunit DhaL
VKESLSKEDLVRVMFSLADDMIAAKDRLTELDAIIGDGDLGVTMVLGFNAVKENLADPAALSLPEVLKKSGMAFADKAASTFGTLTATMFMRAGDVLKGKEVVEAPEFAAMLRAAAEGVQKRGKAKEGDKTILDALMPAAAATEEAAGAGKSLSFCLKAALEAARKGAENTVKMRASAGRSSHFGDRTIGVKDAGAAAFELMLESVARTVGSL